MSCSASESIINFVCHDDWLKESPVEDVIGLIEQCYELAMFFKDG